VHQTGRAFNAPFRNFRSAGGKLFKSSTWRTRAGISGLGKDVGLGVLNTAAIPFRAVGLTLKESGKDFWKGGNIERTINNRSRTQTGNVTEFTDSGKIVTDSATGATLNMQLDDVTVEKNLDGKKTTTDNISGETSTTIKETGHRTLKIFGTFGEINIDASLDSDGNVIGEKTKYNFSEQIQEGHDHFTYQYGGNQVVEDTGVIAPDLQATLGGTANPNYLMFGFAEIFGKNTIAGMSTEDFILNTVFVAGRQRRTNKMRTNISSSLV
jgi:hypothetical protein